MEQEVPHGVIHYEEFGEGRRLLVLHGGYLDHRHMVSALEPVFENRQGWHRIYVDLPGHGRSRIDDDVTSNDQVLENIVNFMDAIAPGETFTLAGESRGGYLARGLVHQRPDSIDGALLIVPGRYAQCDDDDVPDHVTLVRDNELAATLAPHEVDRFNRLVVQNREILEKIRRFKIPAAALADAAHQAKIDKEYEFSFDVDTVPEPFEKPVLFLLGRQDSMVGYRHAWLALENFPRATFAILDRAGHSLSWEQPDLFLTLVRDWLDRVDAY